jgi:hypothetical protein
MASTTTSSTLNQRRAFLARGTLFGVLVATPLSACSLLTPPVLARMDTLSIPAALTARSDHLVVMLPGAYSRPAEFVTAGFPQALRERGFMHDVRVVDSHLGYFTEGSVLRRLREEVVLPARAEGYRKVWLVGISLGGFGALAYAVRHGADIDGVLALAPYLGPRRLTQAIDAAGGARAWLAAGLDAPQPDESEGDLVNRELWRTFAQASTSLPPIHLGFGLSDRFAPAHRRFAELLPAERVSTAAGGHDWRAWRALWEAWLGQGLLAQPLGTPAWPGGAAA